MKAMQVTAYGGPEVLRLADVQDPVAGPGEVVIDIHAASINPADWKVREGFYDSRPWLKLPHVTGRDFSGVIRELGPGVTEFARGDAVFGVTDQGQEGAYAEAIAMKAALIAPKPPSISHAEAAAIALGALTALVSIEDTGRISDGETVLIHGGSGGVGAMAVQIARALGATVHATASEANADYVRALGAERVYAHETEDFAQAGAIYDAVFDTVGGDVQSRSYSVLKPTGRIIFITRGPQAFTPPGGIARLRPDVQRDRAHLDRIAALVAAGRLRPPEITLYALESAGAAQEARRTRTIRGKAVLAVREN